MQDKFVAGIQSFGAEETHAGLGDVAEHDRDTAIATIEEGRDFGTAAKGNARMFSPLVLELVDGFRNANAVYVRKSFVRKFHSSHASNHWQWFVLLWISNIAGAGQVNLQ